MEKEKAALAAAILITILWVGVIGVGIFYHWTIKKDTVAWLHRAQVASNPEDMQKYLVECRNGMEKHGLTDGYAAIIEKAPENYMPLILQALDRSIQRCENIKQFDETSTEYQVALDDVRGQIRELNLYTPYSWWVRHIVFLFLMEFGWLAVAISWIGYAVKKDRQEDWWED